MKTIFTSWKPWKLLRALQEFIYHFWKLLIQFFPFDVFRHSVVSNSLWPHGQHLCPWVFSRQEWSGLPCPPPGDLSNPGIELRSLASPASADGFFTPSVSWLTDQWGSPSALCSWEQHTGCTSHLCTPACSAGSKAAPRGASSSGVGVFVSEDQATT